MADTIGLDVTISYEHAIATIALNTSQSTTVGPIHITAD